MPASTPAASTARDPFNGVLRFLAPQAHATAHQAAAALRTHKAVVVAQASPAPIPHPAPIMRAIARVDPLPPRTDSQRTDDPRLVNRVAYQQYASPRYAYPYAYPRYVYPMVAWQVYGYRAYRYVYYYPYAGGYSGY